MFKIFCNNCCGFDVHKTWNYACIGITDPNGRTEYWFGLLVRICPCYRYPNILSPELATVPVMTRANKK